MGGTIEGTAPGQVRPPELVTNLCAGPPRAALARTIR
jgi:hypothetical protein